jgi:hypothetical protein
MFYLIKQKAIIVFALIVLKSNGFAFLKQKEMSFSFECLIQNENYGFEFLYHSNEFIKSNWSTTMPYVFPLTNLNVYNRIRWIIKATRDDSILETVYIKSFKSNQYLCASNSHLEVFLKRRKVFLSNNFIKDDCEWKIEKITTPNDKDDHNDQLGVKSYITNVKYDQPLYAASYFFKRDHLKRNVYLCHDKNEKKNSKKFNWIIECLDVQHPIYDTSS